MSVGVREQPKLSQLISCCVTEYLKLEREKEILNTLVCMTNFYVWISLLLMHEAFCRVSTLGFLYETITVNVAGHVVTCT